MKANINEIFKSIQGEGQFTGCPSVFVRFNGCNLRCAFKNGSICDTPYTSHSPEKSLSLTVEELVSKISELLINDCKHIVFTGGEPMLQQDVIFETIKNLNQKYDDLFYTIETNGTIIPSTDMLNSVTLWSVSPKLENSCCFDNTNISIEAQERHKKLRFNPEAIYNIINLGCTCQLKFVYSSKESEDEVKGFLKDCEDYWLKNGLYTSIDNKILGIKDGLITLRVWDGDLQIMLMPEGIVESACNSIANECVEVCIRNGWRYCHRVHISIWGDLRGV